MNIPKNILLVGIGISITIVIIAVAYLLFQNVGMEVQLLDGSKVKVNNFLKDHNNTTRDDSEGFVIQSYQDVGSLSYSTYTKSFLLKIDGTTIATQENNLSKFQINIKQLLGINEQEMCLLPISIVNYDIDSLVFPACRQPDSM